MLIRQFGVTKKIELRILEGKKSLPKIIKNMEIIKIRNNIFIVIWMQTFHPNKFLRALINEVNYTTQKVQYIICFQMRNLNISQLLGLGENSLVHFVMPEGGMGKLDFCVCV